MAAETFLTISSESSEDSEDDSSDEDESLDFTEDFDLDSDSEDDTSNPQLDDELDLAATFFTNFFYLVDKMVFFACISTAFASYPELLGFFCYIFFRALEFASSFSSALMSRFLFYLVEDEI